MDKGHDQSRCSNFSALTKMIGRFANRSLPFITFNCRRQVKKKATAGKKFSAAPRWESFELELSRIGPQASQHPGAVIGRAHDIADPSRQLVDAAAARVRNLEPRTSALVVIDDAIDGTPS